MVSVDTKKKELVGDLANKGWVRIGADHDTAEFAVASLRCWWEQRGRSRYPQAPALLITADGGGSNGGRVRLWKIVLQAWAEPTGLSLRIRHFPP